MSTDPSLQDNACKPVCPFTNHFYRVLLNQLIKAMDYHETSESLYTYLVNVARNAIIRSNGCKRKTKRRKQLSSRSGILRLRSRVRRPTPCEFNKLWKTVTYTHEKLCWTSINELMEGRKNNTGEQKSIFIYLSCHLQADTSGRNAGISCQSIKKHSL